MPKLTKQAPWLKGTEWTNAQAAIIIHPPTHSHSLEDDWRHGDLQELFLERNEGQQTCVEQAKKQEDTLHTEDDGNVSVLQEPGKKESKLSWEIVESVAIKSTHSV